MNATTTNQGETNMSRLPQGLNSMSQLPESSVLHIRRTRSSDGWWLAYHYVGKQCFWIDRRTKKALLQWAEHAGMAVRFVD